MPHQQDWSWRSNRDDFPRSRNRPSNHNGSERNGDNDVPSSSDSCNVAYRRQFTQNEDRYNSRTDFNPNGRSDFNPNGRSDFNPNGRADFNPNGRADFNPSSSRLNPSLDQSREMRPSQRDQTSHPRFKPRRDKFNSRYDARSTRPNQDQFYSSYESQGGPSESDHFDSRVGRSNKNESKVRRRTDLNTNKSKHNQADQPYSNQSSSNARGDQSNPRYSSQRERFTASDSLRSGQENQLNPDESRYSPPIGQSGSSKSRNFPERDGLNSTESSRGSYPNRANRGESEYYSYEEEFGSSGPRGSSQRNPYSSGRSRFNPRGDEPNFSDSRYNSRRNQSNSNEPRYPQEDFSSHGDARSYSRNQFQSRDLRHKQYPNESKYNSRSGRFNPSDSRLNPQADQFDPNRSRPNWQEGQFNPIESNLSPQADEFHPRDSKFKSTDNQPFNPDNQGYSSRKPRLKKPLNCDNLDDVSRRSHLTDLLNRGTLECLVCTEYVRQADKVWNCSACYNVFHLKCIIKWSDTSKSDAGWRCPACQNVTAKTPQDYMCFCGKTKLTCGWNRVDDAHSCGEICGRTQKVEPFYKPCIHSCTLLCHPGPCPVCSVIVTRECGCGRTSQSVQCNSKLVVICDSLCSKPLNCLEHYCQQPCHFGECPPCTETYEEVCFCGKVTKTITCGTAPSKNSRFSCGKLCNTILDCKNHKCKRVCHEGKCEPCKFLPDVAKACWCGKTPLTKEQLSSRETCLDPLPTCDSVCGKVFSCGPPDNLHSCQEKCHENACSPCSLKSVVKCRCGSMSKEVNCAQLNTKAAKFQCTKRCTKKRSCGKHKCNQNCCIDAEHICPSICNRRLTCGQHVCEMLCHPGNCPPCSNISFNELACHCGQTVLLPPIPCGTRPPKCNGQCTRQHECEHEPTHNCHSGTTCPPCPVLTTRKCFGGHETRNTIPCHTKEFSCGLACSKPLPCKTHKCIQPCHKGACSKKGKACSQPCPKPRALCGHPCLQACHTGSCPDKPCREMVKVSCQCGHRTSSVPCCENTAEYKKIISSQVVPKASNLHFGGVALELGNLTYGVDAKQLTLKKLECNGECEIIERNRKLALGLQIRNPDLSAKLAPRYSEFMIQWAKKDAQFSQRVHEKLVDLVQLAKQSKQKTRSFSFEVMNRAKRQFVHEYCEHFGVESVSYDAEPKRNVVATASKDTSWIPSYSLMEVMQRQNGQRKIHVPNQNTARSNGTTTKKIEMPVMQQLNPVSQTSCWTLLTKPEPVEPASTSRKSKKPDYFSDDL